MRLDDSTDRSSGTVRVLFVDDEPLVMRGLRRTLATRGLPWELHFSETGEAALELLDRVRIDVIVSDLLMPGMDGATVLARVQETHPDVARIVLSGAEDPKEVLRIAPVAHLSLSKPVETPALVAAISQCIELHALLARPILRAALGAEDRLPKPLPTYAAVTRAIARRGTTLAEIMSILEERPALSSRLGRLASYAPPQAPHARGRLSSYVADEPTVFRALVLLSETAEILGGLPGAGQSCSIEAFERHSVGTAHLAACIIGRRGAAAHAFVAGLLHDIGELVLIGQQAKALAEARSRSARDGIPIEDAERSMLGVSHAELGAYLLGLFGFPLEVVNAALRHDEPGSLGGSDLDVSGAVYVANLLSHDAEAPLGLGVHSGLGLDRFGRWPDASRLEQWRRAARERA
jgi:DNA-binding NarL/FixJ family response regulator